ncbi:uncharacterized protein [Amphiura filiformis]|uniref:uncharacterized protein n=1 Tax=Amphiura filiformis TaxID=82378 RepID=UPI003B20F9FB
MKLNLVIIVAGIFIMFCNFVNSEAEDCITLCNQCVVVSDTLSHMRCTKHCEELKQKDGGKFSCQLLTAPNKGTPSLGDEIKASYPRMYELFASGDYSTIVEELYTDDCVIVINGQAPKFGKEGVKQVFVEYNVENFPSVNRISYTSTAFGENDGYVWEDGTGYGYHDDALVNSWRYIYVYKRVKGNLLHFMDIDF